MSAPFNQRISITTETLVRIVVVGIIIWAAYSARSVLLLVFISLLFATVLLPVTTEMERIKLPRSLSVILLYLVAIAAVVGIGFALAPLLADEVVQIAQNFGSYWDRAMTLLPAESSAYLKNLFQQNVDAIAVEVKRGIAVTIGGLMTTVTGAVGVIGSTVVVLVLTFYLVVEDDGVKKMIALVTPPQHRPLARRMHHNIVLRLGGWARGQLLLSVVIGVLVYLALLGIGVPYAFALAALAFLLEFIPYAGPFISALFGIFFALTVSPFTALIAAGAYYVIQLLENNVIVPKIMQKTAGVNPALSIVSVLVCFELFGVIGILLGVPIAALAVAIAESYVD